MCHETCVGLACAESQCSKMPRRDVISEASKRESGDCDSHSSADAMDVCFARENPKAADEESQRHLLHHDEEGCSSQELKRCQRRLEQTQVARMGLSGEKAMALTRHGCACAGGGWEKASGLFSITQSQGLRIFC